MANPEHVALVRAGRDALESWRQQSEGTQLDLQGADFSGKDLSAANLWQANMQAAQLAGANLSDADLRAANLRAANLAWANLTRASFLKASLVQANLHTANLSEANLSMANLSEAKLSNANLRRANMTFTNLSEARMSGVDLSEAQLGRTVLGFLDLREVEGLGTVIHHGPSSIGIETIYESRGEIPEVFLRGAGVPDTFITFAQSLVGKPFDFYSCFISHSSIDKEFAERLHADLHAKGVRCWYAPEDLKIGDKFRTHIDEAIRIHDKLLIILSVSSVRSAWVETEVEQAFERERRENRTVLFPIRIDDAAMETDAAWAADIRRTRHIGDFRNWKDHDSYQKAFDRLLRDLKSDAQPTHTD